MSRIFSVSASTRDEAISFNGLDNKRFEILPGTLDPFFGHAIMAKSREELSLPVGAMILSVSRLDVSERHKMVDGVIEIMSEILYEVPDAFYVVVGDGADRRRLEQVATDTGVRDKVIFCGWVPPDLLASYYQACDVFVLPSLKEGFGIVFLEAMYYAKPCIGARAGGIPEVIQDGETGLLAEPGNRKSLVTCIVLLLTNRALGRAMGQAGKDRFEQQFSFGLFRRRLEKLLFLGQ